MGEWLGEVFDELFALDARLPRSLRKLAWPPGELTLEWRRGRRARYVSPFRLYLAAALLFFLAGPFTGFQSNLGHFTAGVMEGFAEGLGGVQEGVNADDQAVQVATQSITENLPGMLLILFVPLFAGLLYVVNRGRGCYVADLITAFHLHTVVFLVLILPLPFSLLLGDIPWKDWVLPPLLLGLIAFSAISIRRIYGTSILGAIVRTITVGTAYLFVTMFTIGIVGLISANA